MRRSIFAGALVAVLSLSSITAVVAQDGWVPYTEDQLGGGTVNLDARPEGPLPAGCPMPEAKDSYVIGMSQANRAEPWREAMDSQIAGSCRRVPRDRGRLPGCRTGQRRPGQRCREPADPGHRPADHLPQRGGTAQRHRQGSLGCLHPGHRPRPQPRRSELLDVHRRRQRRHRAGCRRVCREVVRRQRPRRVQGRRDPWPRGRAAGQGPW